MTYSLSNNCTKNDYNRTLAVQVIVEDVVTWIFLRHTVEVRSLCCVNRKGEYELKYQNAAGGGDFL